LSGTKRAARKGHIDEIEPEYGDQRVSGTFSDLVLLLVLPNRWKSIQRKQVAEAAAQLPGFLRDASERAHERFSADYAAAG
jgi:hypothetical protein